MAPYFAGLPQRFGAGCAINSESARAMPHHIRRGDATKSRSAQQSSMSSPSTRIGWPCSSAPLAWNAKAKVGLVNIASNTKRLNLLRTGGLRESCACNSWKASLPDAKAMMTLPLHAASPQPRNKGR